MRIEDLLIRQQNNSKIALKCNETIISFEDWYYKSLDLSVKIASLIRDCSYNVAIFLPNSIEYAVAYFGILFSKKTVIPVGIFAKFPEIFSTLNYCEVDLIITHSKYVSEILNNIDKYKNQLKVILIDGNETLILNSTMLLPHKSGELEFEHNDNDVAIMLHTSGTTTNPKRVMLTHKNIISNIESNIASLDLSVHDKSLICLPMCFGYCNTSQFLTHLYLGACQVIMHTVFLPKYFFELVSSERITNFTAVPTMLLMLLDYRYSDSYDYSSLRFICFGGGKMPIDSLKKLILMYPTIGFIHTYGQTECSPRITSLMPRDSLRKIGSVGKPIPNVCIKIRSDTTNLCDPFEIGEITVFGNNVMKGYYKDHKETKKTLIDNWIRTGDLGYIDDEGYLYIVGRIKNLIISGGINIYPEEIEQILCEIDGVEDAIVYGKSHEKIGEIVCANIVKKGNCTLTEKDIINHCRKMLAEYKVPKYIKFVTAIKKTYNGKSKRCKNG